MTFIKSIFSSMVTLLKNKRVIFYCVMAITFLFLLLLNICTPIAIDDFAYSYSFKDGSRITSLSQLVESMQIHYYTMNGRTVPHIVSTIFLCFDMWIFDIINSLVFVLFGCLIYRFVTVKKVYYPGFLSIIYIILFLTLPVFGQTVLWLTGSCNYLWGIFLMLLFILPYRIHLEKTVNFTWWQTLLFSCFSFIAGGYTENTSGAIICLAGMLMVCMLFLKIKWKLWMFLGGICYSIGFLFVILSPSVQRRVALSGGDRTSVTIQNQFLMLTNTLKDRSFYLLLFITIMILLAIHFKNNKKILIIPTLLVISGLLCTYVLAFITYYVDRAYFGPQVFFIMAAAYLWYHVEIPWIEVTKKVIVSFLLLQFAFTGFSATGSIILSYNWSLDRLEIFDDYLALGVKDVETFTILMDDHPHCIYYFYGSDLFDSSDMWLNNSVAKYYGLDSITPNQVKSWK